MAGTALSVTGAQLSRRSVLNAAGGAGLAALAAAWGPPANRSVTPRSAAKLTSNAELTAVARRPIGSFLENVAVRGDGSMLVTELSKKELWYVPAPAGDTPVQPVLLYTFDQPPFDIQEATRNVFYVDTTTYLTTHESFL